MKGFKCIEDFSITDCCCFFKIKPSDLPEIIGSIQENPEHKEIKKHLLQLIKKDNHDFALCSSIEEYKKYLNLWKDGLHRDEATKKITVLEAEAEELAFYKTNKNSISGLENYIKRYPNGKFTHEAKGVLANKKRARKIRNIILLIIAIIVAIVVCVINYFPVTYLDVSEDVSFGKKGGHKTISILTDANDINIDVQESYNWISVDRNGGTLSINVLPNTGDEKIAYITINTYSSFFGNLFNCISKSIKISQSSGLPTYLNTNTSKVSFDKYGNSSSNQITAITDGCDLQVSTTASWFSVSKDIKEDGDNMIAYISLRTSTNNEGDKTGEVVISCNDFVKKVKVSQASGLATDFIVKTKNLIMSKEGGNYYVPVYTDGTSWYVKNAPDWLTANATSRRLEVSVGANTGKIKSGTITVMSNNGDIRGISVSQDGDPTNFGTTKSSIKFGTSSDYEYVTIYNDSRKQPSISEYESWISASVIDKNRIKISCSHNEKDPPRSGTVYVACGNEKTSIIVKQDGWSRCNTCMGNKRINCNSFLYWNTRWRSIPCADGTIYNQHEAYLPSRIVGADPNYKVWQTCPKCEGCGTISCPDCDGKGKIIKPY